MSDAVMLYDSSQKQNGHVYSCISCKNESTFHYLQFDVRVEKMLLKEGPYAK